MKNIVVCISVVLSVIFSGCVRKEDEKYVKKYLPEVFDYYGDIDYKLKGYRWRAIINRIGEPDVFERIDYPECYDAQDRRILPLHNVYLNRIDCSMARAVWHDFENSGDDLILYVKLDDYWNYHCHYWRPDERHWMNSGQVFWGIRCLPEKTDSVISLYTTELITPDRQGRYGESDFE